MTRAHVLAIAAALLLPLAACGKKGPPLAPLRPAPAQVTDVTGRRAGSEMRISFTLPTQNLSGIDRIDLEQIEVHAITVGPGGIVPPVRQFLTRKYVVKTIPVKPPPVDEEAPAEGAPVKEKPAVADPRPLPGERATFVESLTPEVLTPVATTKPVVVRPKSGADAPPVPAVLDPAVTTRFYVFRGRSRRGQPGAAVRVALPLVDPPPPPSNVQGTVAESAVTFTWTAPPAALDPVAAAMNEQAWAAANAPILPRPVPPPPRRPSVDPVAPTVDPGVLVPLSRLPGTALPLVLLPLEPRFNVYAVKGGAIDEKPLNTVPLLVPSYSGGAPVWNEELCIVVRTIRTYQLVSVESETSAPTCLTPLDTFPPAAPTGLRAVPIPGAINLIWDANKEPDLAGYIVLRGIAPGDTLQALTPAPIRETSFRDTTVTPGVQYVYAIVAVDQAAKPNMSPQSARQSEAAR